MTVSSSAPKTASQSTDIVYPTGDGSPVAETFDHLYALLITLEVLKQYLRGQQATVLGNQFLYYAQGYPRARTAPDVMVIFGVEPGGRDSFKIWEEGTVPSVIFEITSPSTRIKDETFKKDLYLQLGVQEYWQFDPKGEWIPEKLRGYRLHDFTTFAGQEESVYEPITDGQCQPLQLRLVAEGKLIAFYRLDTGEKLLLPEEMADALRQETLSRQEAEAIAQAERQRAEELEAQLERYRERFGELPED
ncbi:Uma2 family endonuclease [Thermoleptolyngbya sp. C42_A2020_037]|uniref:Uma2 family endonuclease n=1 Tax=Thermoleptolyngbya sp. C42_A2020_037 TaxID=2747799 RepID=UPI0019EBD0B9|nr:Uma2 family endonuclease [Thermoleptolyngbya sp. C42_A2020_037]MBF2085458.1 Uma2 family endonuclease [Thermoleptolyngbya sp. C42_A2020_037]